MSFKWCERSELSRGFLYCVLYLCMSVSLTISLKLENMLSDISMHQVIVQHLHFFKTTLMQIRINQKSAYFIPENSTIFNLDSVWVLMYVFVCVWPLGVSVRRESYAAVPGAWIHLSMARSFILFHKIATYPLLIQCYSGPPDVAACSRCSQIHKQKSWLTPYSLLTNSSLHEWTIWDMHK